MCNYQKPLLNASNEELMKEIAKNAANIVTNICKQVEQDNTHEELLMEDYNLE